MNLGDFNWMENLRFQPGSPACCTRATALRSTLRSSEWNLWGAHSHVSLSIRSKMMAMMAAFQDPVGLCWLCPRMIKPWVFSMVYPKLSPHFAYQCPEKSRTRWPPPEATQSFRILNGAQQLHLQIHADFSHGFNGLDIENYSNQKKR